MSASPNRHKNFAADRLAMSIWRTLTFPDVRWPICLAVLTLLLYGRTVGFDFVNFDDDVHVYQNPDVRAGLSWSGIIWAFTIHGPSQWHPLAWLSHQLDWQLFGPHPAGHHFTNLLLHLFGAVLLFFAMKSLLRRSTAAAFIAAMFAVHPLNIESVAWISERRNVLCGVFWMAGLIAYVRYARKGGIKHYVWVTLWLVLALMSKPLAVTLPCVFALLDYWPLRRCRWAGAWQPAAFGGSLDPCPTFAWMKLLLEKLPWLLLSAGASWLSYLCQESIQVVSDFETLPWRLRVENACVAYGLYLRRMVWPVDLAVFYPHPAWQHPRPDEVLMAPAILSAAILLLVTAIVIWQIRRTPGLAVGWLWFLGTLVPMIGLIQVGRQQLADRYAYISMIGLGLMAVSVRFPTRFTRAIPRLAVVIMTFWFGMSAWLVGYWQNSKSLFSRAVDVTRDNSWAHLNLGLARQAEGDYAQAIENYQQALNVDPNYALAHYNLGIAWQDIGRLEPAVRHLSQAVALQKKDVNGWVRLGTAFGQMKRFDRAEECFRQAIIVQDRSAQARYNLGLVLQARGRVDESLAEFQQAVQLDPQNVQFRTGWMLALDQSAQLPEAQNQAREILKLDPASRAARQVLSQ